MDTGLLAGYTLDGFNRIPVLAARALPVMGTQTKAAVVATINETPIEQLLREVLENQQVVSGFAFTVGQVQPDQRIQAAH